MSQDTIESTIEKLKVLQDILSRKFSVEREIEELPRTLATKRELVSRLKKSFVEKNEKYEETRKRVAETRVRLQEAEADRERFESQMDQITTAREYDALEKEIRDASEREQNYRRDLARDEKDLHEQLQRIEREQSMIEAQETELEQERAKIDEETEARRQMLTDLKKQETSTIPGLDEELLFKFERIIRSKAGEGIVPIRNGVCTGCQMILPNQFVNDVRAGEEILFCPYCSKIVFHTEDDTGAEQVGFADSDEEGLVDLVDDDFDDDLFDDDLVGYDDGSGVLADDEDEDQDEESGLEADADEGSDDEDVEDDDDDESDEGDILDGDDEGEDDEESDDLDEDDSDYEDEDEDEDDA